MLKKVLLAAGALFALSAGTSAQAQQPVKICVPGVPNSHNCIPVDANNPLPVDATVSATVAGGFTASAIGTPFTASEAGQVGTLPAGDIVVVSDGGGVGAYCNLGATPSQTGVYIAGGGGWFAFTKGAATQVACQTKPGDGNVVINMVGGTGLPTGTGGGGGGGGGGGAVTIADGADVTQGAKADPAYTGSGDSTVVAAIKGVYSILAANIYTPGVAGTPSSQVLTMQGISGGTPSPVSQATAANLNATVIGAGAAGSANAGVMTVQGIASMTHLLVTPDANSTVNSQPTPVTTGGLSVFFLQPIAGDNHATIKAGAGQVYKISVTNNSATVNYLRLYNATTGFAGCGSASNIVYQMAIPANTSGAGYADSWDLGMAFATGISICVTSGYATTDTTNATASAISLNIGYK